MCATYPTLYHDSAGDEKTVIELDGRKLRMNVRGVTFWGYSFHGFEPVEGSAKSKLESFTLFLGDLCSYTLDCDIAVMVVRDQTSTQSILHAHIEYGDPVEGVGSTSVRLKDGSIIKDDRCILHEVLQLEIAVGGHVYQTSGKSRYNSFDEQLTELIALMPPEYSFKICWTCNYSDYSPAGSGLFGGLACFRSTKEQYRQVTDKKSLFALWDRRAEDVPEVYLCPEYEKRQPGSGLYVGEEYPGKRG